MAACQRPLSGGKREAGPCRAGADLTPGLPGRRCVRSGRNESAHAGIFHDGTSDAGRAAGAVGFFAAKRLYDEFKVPVGLVHAAQGGASIEAWMPLDLLDGFGDYRKQAEPFLADGSVQEFLKNQDITQGAWREMLKGDLSQGLESGIPADAKDINVPFIKSGTDDDRFFGSMWYYREFELEGDLNKDEEAYMQNPGKTSYQPFHQLPIHQ